MTQTNPLAKHFRQPAIYLKLPSQGKYWPNGSIELSVTGDIPVYPMTTKDEIVLRTPDALINGNGVVEVIRSCIPSIIDPWAMPSVDVDACLVAIRIASYGNEMNITTTCPSCKHQEERTIDLTTLLGKISMPEYSALLSYKDLKLKFRPQNYFAVNRANSIRFKEDRILETLSKTDITPEERELNIKQITEEMIDLNFESLANSTEYILLADGDHVTEFEYIYEFYANAESALIRKIQTKLGNVAESAGMPSYDVTCSECSHEYKTTVEFDYANFFGLGS